MRVEGSNTFKYCGKPDVKRYSAQSIMMVVHFAYDHKRDVYSLDESQLDDINSELRKLQSVRRKSKSKSVRVSQKRRSRHKQEARDLQNDRSVQYRSSVLSKDDTNPARTGFKTHGNDYNKLGKDC